jgi:hypothetical protein
LNMYRLSQSKQDTSSYAVAKVRIERTTPRNKYKIASFI